MKCSHSSHLSRSLLRSFSLANGTSSSHPSTPAPPAVAPQKKKQEKEKDSPAQKPVKGEPAPRPLSLRGKPHSWGLLRGRNKSYSLGHYSGEKSARNLNMVLSSEGGGGCSLLDVDTEGQKRDCTVPLCRIQSSPGRPSVFELEKEFLS